MGLSGGSTALTTQQQFRPHADISVRLPDLQSLMLDEPYSLALRFVTQQIKQRHWDRLIATKIHTPQEICFVTNFQICDWLAETSARDTACFFSHASSL